MSQVAASSCRRRTVSGTKPAFSKGEIDRILKRAKDGRPRLSPGRSLTGRS